MGRGYAESEQELREQAAQRGQQWGVGPKPKHENLSERQLDRLRALRVGDRFSRGGVQYVVQSRRPGRLVGTAPDRLHQPITISWDASVEYTRDLVQALQEAADKEL
jgi:hypothetical protein